MRSSRQDTEKHREAIIDAAARLAREKGLDAVSIPELMAEIGMTHGGFYKHFASKEALAPVAFERAFGAVDGLLEASATNHPNDPTGAQREFLATYLSPAHRDNPGTGCATSALAGDVARADCGCVAQQAYVTGVEQMVSELQAAQGDTSPDAHQQALVKLSTMVGALLLSRATRGNAISDDLLTAALGVVSPKPE
ncbi:MAG: TetR family transcriptional regulator [Devosia sp.]|uniref:TetR/AcrR family transcriptional regulator n=1 Tax=Devosia sp. TaxID=1871048 RepID=UPI00260DA13B|nr:TetR/AcrR family transcriptional regulator [Devosia sp.]MDB5536737.1 TetR family transcriptional regulator [Devosia sp.]MDB5589459.1 TetR family transcriptional regulator [Devosia sp.]